MSTSTPSTTALDSLDSIRQAVLISNDGWQNLSPAFPDTELPVALAIFKRYSLFHTQKVLKSDCELLKSRECIRILKRSLRDLFMAYMISGKKSEAASLLDVCRFMKLDTVKLFSDINEMFEKGFDKFWKINAIIYVKLFATSQKTSIPLRVAMNAIPDETGNHLKELPSMPSLLLYRTVHHLKRLSPNAECYPKPATHEADAKLPCDIFYAASLTFHSPLIEKITEMFNLFYQTEDKKKPDLSADALRDILLKGDEARIENLLGCFRFIHSHVHYSFFPSCEIPKEIEPPETLSSINLDLATSPSIQQRQALFRDIVKDPTSVLLPHEQRRALISFQIEDAENKAGKSEDKLISELSKLLWNTYKTSSSAREFYSVVFDLAQKINVLSKKLHQKPTPFTDSWEKMLSGKLSKQQLTHMISQLNKECVRLYRYTDVYDLCPAIEKFISREDPIPSSRMIKRNQSDVTQEIDSSIRTSSTTSSSSDFTLTPRSDLSLSPREEADDEEIISGAPIKTVPLTLNTLSIRISEILIAKILDAPDEKSAKKIVINAIQFAVFCLDGPVVNYHVARSIFMGFIDKTVDRLKFLFDTLPSQPKRNYLRLCELFDRERNFANYREAVSSTTRPYIPHIAFFQSDLTMATESNVTEEQIRIVARIMDEFKLMTAWLKVAVPVNPHVSDCSDQLQSFNFEASLQMPRQKNEFGLLSDWEEGEWEDLSPDEKCWYISCYRWPKPKS